jgi:hypothetical protein
VPVVSDIPSGVPELVTPDVTGFRPPVGDVAAFADAIVALAQDPARLDRLSRAAHAHVARQFDPVARARDYQRVFDQWPERTRRVSTPPLPYGSRLDHPWIPNAVVRTVRTAVRRWRVTA